MGVEILRGTATGTDDVQGPDDVLAVHVASTRELLGLSVTAAVSRATRESPSLISFELGKFCEMGLACDPAALHLLWVGHYQVATDAGLLLVRNRSAFLSSAAVIDTYATYARQEAQKIERAGTRRRAETQSDSAALDKLHNRGRSVYSTFLKGVTVLTTGEFALDINEHGKVIDFMANLAAHCPNEFAARMTVEAQAMTATESPLPTEPEYDLVDELVRQIRTQQVRTDLDKGL
jgi:hypothetical protein